jgi:type III secretion protein J
MLRAFCIVPVILLLAACSRRLATGLSERDAQEIVVTLREHGIDAMTEMELGSKKDASGWQVNVRGGSDRVVEAWSVLRQNGLPREKDPGLKGVFANAGMIPTAGEEKARLMVGLAGELTNTLNSITGVVDAHVNVVVPDNNPLLDKSEQNPPSASVLVRYQGNQPPLTETEIKNLVARGVEGLALDNVSVVWKRVPDKPLPPRTYGPLLANEWVVLGALTFAGLTSAGALALVFVSRRRKLQIKELEQEIGTPAPVKNQAEGAPEAARA